MRIFLILGLLFSASFVHAYDENPDQLICNYATKTYFQDKIRFTFVRVGIASYDFQLISEAPGYRSGSLTAHVREPIRTNYKSRIFTFIVQQRDGKYIFRIVYKYPKTEGLDGTISSPDGEITPIVCNIMFF